MPYAREITRAVEAAVSKSAQIDHPIIREPERPQRAALLILTSDRGFAGGYNANVLREAQGLRGLFDERGVEAVTYVTGQKGITWHRFRGREIAAEWSGFSETPRTENAREITEALLDAFGRDSAEGGVDEIHCVYTEFVSMLSQNAVVRGGAAHRAVPPVRIRAVAAGRAGCPAALVRGEQDLPRAAGGRRLGNRGAAAGDEISHRQRQRTA